MAPRESRGKRLLNHEQAERRRCTEERRHVPRWEQAQMRRITNGVCGREYGRQRWLGERLLDKIFVSPEEPAMPACR
jgi:hypothetical protein